MVKVHRIRDTSKQTPNLTWVPVADADGRIRMEMRWSVSPKGGSLRRPSHAA